MSSSTGANPIPEESDVLAPERDVTGVASVVSAAFRLFIPATHSNAENKFSQTPNNHIFAFKHS